MRLAIAAGCTLLVGGMPAFAQTTPVPPPVTVAAPTPERLAAARDLMVQIFPPATRDRMFDSMLGPMMNAMAQSLQRNPEIAAASQRDPRFAGVMDRFMQRQIERSSAMLKANAPEMIEAMARAYARRFTLVQLRELGIFFATPTGAAYLIEAPGAMADPDVLAWMQGLMAKSQQGVRAEMDAFTKELEALEAGEPRAH